MPLSDGTVRETGNEETEKGVAGSNGMLTNDIMFGIKYMLQRTCVDTPSVSEPVTRKHITLTTTLQRNTQHTSDSRYVTFSLRLMGTVKA